MTARDFTPLRREDPALLTGQGRYTSDICVPGMLHAVFVRAQVAQTPLLVVEVDAARAMPGVLAVLSAQAWQAQGLPVPVMPAPNPLLPLSSAPRLPVLAHGQLAYVGQPVALVVAQSLAQAQAAAQAVTLTTGITQTSPPGLAPNAQSAPPPSPLVQVSHQWRTADTGTEADPTDACKVALDLTVPRILAMAMEPRGMLAHWTTEQLTVWLGTQAPSRAQADIAACTGLPLAQVRVISGDVGGAFGAKSSLCPEDLVVALAATQLQTAVRWQATRSEEFTSGMQGRDARLAATLSVSANGQLLGLQARLRFDLGVKVSACFTMV